MHFFYLALGVIIGSIYTTFIDFKKIKSLQNNINKLYEKYEPWKKLEHIDK